MDSPFVHLAALGINYMHTHSSSFHSTRHTQAWSLASAFLCSTRRSSCLHSHANLMRWPTGPHQKSPNLFGNDFKPAPSAATSTTATMTLLPASSGKSHRPSLFILNATSRMFSILRWAAFLLQG